MRFSVYYTHGVASHVSNVTSKTRLLCCLTAADRAQQRLLAPSTCAKSVFDIIFIIIIIIIIFIIIIIVVGVVIVTIALLVQLKELLEGPYRTLEAFRAEGKSSVSCSPSLLTH